jgi:hypothetical protein
MPIDDHWRTEFHSAYYVSVSLPTSALSEKAFAVSYTLVFHSLYPY